MQRRAFITALAVLATAGSAGTALALPARGPRLLLKSYVTRIDAELLNRLAECAGDVQLRLTPAPERRFDPASLAVRTVRGEVLGYLPGTHSRALGPVVEAGFAVTPRTLATRRHPRPALELEIWLDG